MTYSCQKPPHRRYHHPFRLWRLIKFKYCHWLMTLQPSLITFDACCQEGGGSLNTNIPLWPYNRHPVTHHYYVLPISTICIAILLTYMIVLNTKQPKSSQLFDIKIRVNGCTFFQPTIYSLSKSFTSHRIYSPQNSSDYKFQGPPSSYSITPVCIPCLYPSGNRLKNVPSSNLVASSVFRISSKSFCSGC